MTRPRAVWTAVLLLAVLALALVAGWKLWLSRKQPGPPSLSPVSYAALPGWAASDPRPALVAFRRSCDAILRLPSQHEMGGTGYAGTAGDWAPVCRNVPDAHSARDARAWFEDQFRPYAVSAGGDASGLFTGYYEPVLRGSARSHGAYREPVYGYPSDLIEVDLGQFRDALKGERIAGRIDGHRLVPYATRAEIDAHGLAAAPTLFYGDDPVSVFFLHIQGSGRVRFDDGRVFRVVYAGQNGQPYTPVGRALIEQGAIAREHMSMQAIRDWMKANPGKARRVMEEDRSFVFFRIAPVGDASLGSDGAEGVPLTAEASLAVDPRIHALGVPMFVAAMAPADDPSAPERAFQRLLVAQDMGGAIRGAVRGDVYFGSGTRAESLAGRMKSDGQLYVLLPKLLGVRSGPQT